MRVLLVTGIFPPDIGGPASHAADLRAELCRRGHHVELLSLTDERSPIRDSGMLRIPRSWPWPLRNALALGWVATRGRRFDVVYATGLDPNAVAGARLARRPVVLKIVGDPAWERSTRRGLTDAGFDDFQHEPNKSPAVRGMKWLRSWSASHATMVITPSDHLRRTVERWSGREDIVVVPNGVRVPLETHARDETSSGLAVLFAGRLVPWKRGELLIQAVAGAGRASLDIVGDGPERDSLQRVAGALGRADRVRFLGARPHDEVMQRMLAADVFALASSYEGMPHVLIEALASGTPVVSTRDAGSNGLVVDGVNGILVDPSPDAFASAFDQLAQDPALLARLSDGALESGREWTIERCTDRIEQLLASVTRPRPCAVFLGRGAVPSPLDSDHQQKYAIHGRHVDSIVVCSGERFRVEQSPHVRVVAVPNRHSNIVSTPAFYALAPLVALGAAAGHRPGVVVCQSPYEAAGTLAARGAIPRRWRPRVQVELHGDWQTATRLYGSPHRRRLSRVSDRVAVWAIRRADRIRVVSTVLAERAREVGYRGPIDNHIAFSDYGAFYNPPPRPLPRHPHVLFAGVLERYKAVEVLLDAWPEVLERVPSARLTLLGGGSQEDALRAQIARTGLDASVTMIAPRAWTGVRELLDQSWCLCLPSRSEGLPRIVLEAMAAGRAVVATRVGGVEELVTDGENGRLVAPEESHALAHALAEVISDRTCAERMGAQSRRRAESHLPLEEYEAGIERLSQWIASR